MKSKTYFSSIHRSISNTNIPFISSNGMPATHYSEGYRGNSISDGPGETPPHLILIPVILLVTGVVLWGAVHGLWDVQAWQGLTSLKPLDYVAEGTLGQLIEVVFWVNTAVQLRWISNALAVNSRSMPRGQYWRLLLFDTLNTPVICWIIIVIAQSISITVAGSTQFTLASLDVTLFGAISAILGMSVRETRALFLGLKKFIFSRIRDINISDQ